MLNCSKNFSGGFRPLETLLRGCRGAGWAVIVFSEVFALAAAESSWPGPHPGTRATGSSGGESRR